VIAEGFRKHLPWVIASLAAFVLLACLPFFVGAFHVRVAQLFLFSAGLALAWTILGGFAGYWSFGHTVFIGLGAFAGALVEEAMPRGSPALALAAGLLAGSFACAVLAALLAFPILRLRGIYFAIAMLGVSQVFAELNNNIELFKGSMGVVLPQAAPRSVAPEIFYYYLFLAATALTLLFAFLVKVSRLGHGLLAIREDEDTARMLGVPTELYKSAMFVLSAVLTGALGVLYAHSLGYITVGSVYRTDFSLNMIVYPLLGGMGTLLGPIIGALFMIVLTQLVLGHLLDLHMFLTGAIIVALVLLAPRGILGYLTPLIRRTPS
jgi:branched-chain amino acid transport system permease protein